MNTQQLKFHLNSTILLGSASSWFSSLRDQINTNEELNLYRDEFELEHVKVVTDYYGTPFQRVIHSSLFRCQGMGPRLSTV